MNMGLFTALTEDVYPTARQNLASGFTFNIKTAGVLAWASQLAYEVRNQEKLDRIIARWGWQRSAILAGRFASRLPLVSTRGFVAMAGADLVIAFAGTEPTSLLNWITDFDIFRTEDGVTEGFLAGFEAVGHTVKQLIAETGGNVFFAGHSLGGALAVVAAKCLIDKQVLAQDRIQGIYTIGMPRPGNDIYAQAYNEAADRTLGQRTFRLIHGDDVVPRVPPSSPPFNFRHVGVALSCPHGGLFSEVPAAQDEGVVLRLDAAFEADDANPDELPAYPAEHPVAANIAAALPPELRDHLPDRYLAALRVLTIGRRC